MATEILVPKLGMTMTEGTVEEWYIPDGGEVKQGENIYRLETEKIEFEVEAENDGIVRHTVPAGTTLEPGSVVGYILAPGEAMPEGVAAAPAGVAATAPVPAQTAPQSNGARPGVTLEGGRVPASPIARRLAKEAGLDVRAITGSGPGGRVVEADVLAAKAAPPPAAAPAAAAPGREVLASPLARKLAQQYGLDLQTMTGTGPGGRITQEDVETARSAPRPVPAATPAATPTPGAGEILPMRGIRRVIAERMHQSLAEMAQLTMGADVVMDEAVKLRTQLVAEWEPEGIRPTYIDLFIKAVAKALRRHPRFNAQVTAAGIELMPDVHIGMAVALDEGLVVPVIRNADVLPLRDIAVESTRLATAAREGKLGMDEMSGSSFSITSLGASGVDFFTPIINPPNVAILGVGQIRDGLRWDGDRPVKQRQMTLSLTIDHRPNDGAPAAAFLGTIRELLEAPYRLLV